MMKQAIMLRSAAAGLLLTFMLQGNVPQTAFADIKWNPVTWFGDSTQKDLEEAEQQAKEAERIAEEALKKVEKARKRAEEVQARQTRTDEKPVVTRPDTSPRVETGTATSPGFIPTTPNFTEEPQQAQEAEKVEIPAMEADHSQGAPKNTGWNLTKLFKDAKTTEQAELKTPASSATTPEKSQGINLLNLFQKNETKEKPEEPAEQKPAPAPAANLSLKSQAALIETEKGNIAIELYPDEAPVTVNNFAKLVNEGFYNKYNMKFHRVIPGFVIQTGDPTGTGAGGSKDRIPLEAKNKLTHNAKGMVAMARGPDPNSASSQFYITLTPQTNLDGKYAIFGRVISGLDVLEKIEKDDMLYGVRLVDINTITRDQPVEKKGLFSNLF